MADFHLWSKATLVEFATEAAAKLAIQADTIADLRVTLNRLEVQLELAQPASPDTLKHADTTALDGRLPEPDSGRRRDGIDA